MFPIFVPASQISRLYPLFVKFLYFMSRLLTKYYQCHSNSHYSMR